MSLFKRMQMEKKRIIEALICLTLLGCALLFFYYCKGKNEFYMSMQDKLIVVICTLISVFLILINRRINVLVSYIGEILCVLLAPLALYKKMEPMVNNMETIKPDAGLFNWLIILSIFLIGFGIFQNAGISVLVSGGLVYAFYVIDYFTVSFRGSPVLFSDILSVKTAAGVSGGYTYVLNDIIVTGFYELVLLSCIGFFFSNPRKLKTRLIYGLISAVVGVFTFTLLVCSNITTDRGFRNSAFIPTQSAEENGLLLNCAVNLHSAMLPEPSGYSAEAVNRIIEKYANHSNEALQNKEPSNIIVIMNESFTDVDYLETVKTSEDTIPFFKSLEDKSISGTLISSILGGNTPNSEFEFLTGCSLAFLPTGMVAYQQLISNELPTVATMLEESGYKPIAEHLYKPEYFDRQRIYPLLGFDTFINEDNYSREDVVVHYPRNNTGYAADSSSYELIKKEIERKEAETKMFCFCVTVQNHGGYWAGMNSVQALGLNNGYADEYVSLLKMSDDAFKEFITYFETIEEPTIVCMYGDHQPYLFADDFVPIWEGCEYTEEEKRYMQAKVPFVIWANYDIEPCDMGEMSINYLGPTLMKAAGMPMSDFFWYLDDLREELPVISAVCYVDKDGNHFTDAGTSEYAELIKEYEFLQYNYLKGNTGTEFYR